MIDISLCCQDRIMVTITCMLVVANVQSSVGDMIPKTSYFKMIDYFLLYSLNIIILVMVGKRLFIKYLIDLYFTEQRSITLT